MSREEMDRAIIELLHEIQLKLIDIQYTLRMLEIQEKERK